VPHVRSRRTDGQTFTAVGDIKCGKYIDWKMWGGGRKQHRESERERERESVCLTELSEFEGDRVCGCVRDRDRKRLIEKA